MAAGNKTTKTKMRITADRVPQVQKGTMIQKEKDVQRALD